MFLAASVFHKVLNLNLTNSCFVTVTSGLIFKAKIRPGVFISHLKVDNAAFEKSLEFSAFILTEFFNNTNNNNNNWDVLIHVSTSCPSVGGPHW